MYASIELVLKNFVCIIKHVCPLLCYICTFSAVSILILLMIWHHKHLTNYRQSIYIH